MPPNTHTRLSDRIEVQITIPLREPEQRALPARHDALHIVSRETL
jgi:hypothetical protein